jgi:hypothetical protein
MRAAIDRFEGNKAVLLCGDDEEFSAIFPRKYLPKNVEEGAILDIKITYDEPATKKALAEAQALLAELQQR